MSNCISVLVVEDSDLHKGYIRTETNDGGSVPIKLTFWGEAEGQPFDASKVRDYILSRQNGFDFIVLDLSWSTEEEQEFRKINSVSRRGLTLDAIKHFVKEDKARVPGGVQLLATLQGNEIPVIIFTWARFPGWDRFATEECGANYVLHKDEGEFKLLPRCIRSGYRYRQRLKSTPLHKLKGNSPTMLKVRRDIEDALRAERGTVYLNGPSGSGKTTIAKVIAPGLIGNTSKPFLVANGGTMGSDVIEVKLFGNVANFPQHPNPATPGYFGKVEDGVLFIDEVDKFDLKSQRALLEATDDDPRYTPVGSQEHLPVRCRIIVASVCDLEELVQKGSFLLELFQRLKEKEICLPSLNAHREDIPALTELFLTEAMDALGWFDITITEDAVAFLVAADWSMGNCRQLRKAVRDLVRLAAPTPWIEAGLVEQYLKGRRCSEEPKWTLPASKIDLCAAVDEYEREMVRQALVRVSNLRTKQERLERGAELLGLTVHQLDGRIRKYEIQY